MSDRNDLRYPWPMGPDPGIPEAGGKRPRHSGPPSDPNPMPRFRLFGRRAGTRPVVVVRVDGNGRSE